MNIFELAAKITLDSSQYEDGIEKAKGGMSKFAKGLGVAAKAAGAAVAAASTAVVAFGKSAVEAGATFDSSMSQVAATMGTTVDKISELRDFAQEMGRTTAFSASQAADALNYMALAGYDAATSMEMLPTVLDLAASGGIDLARASDMVTDASSALGLSIDETKVMIDQMAVASSKTNTSVAQLGEAILTVGGNAKNLKGGTQELTQVIGLMADNGIKASEAGTHLRNIMLAMTPSTNEAADAWERLGIEAYDSSGELRSMSDVFGDLSKAMDGMSAEEKTNTLSAMFNKTDLAAVNALLDTSADRWQEVSDAIGNYEGAASKMAATQLDNLNGDITYFKSALEGAQIAISDKVTPALREFVQFGTDGLSKLTDAFNKDGFDGAMDVFGDILEDGIAMIVDMLPNVLAAGTEIVTSLVNGIVAAFPELVQSGGDMLMALLQGLIDNAPAIMDGVMAAISAFIDFVTQNLPQIIEMGFQILVQLTVGIIRAIPQLVAKIPEIIKAIISGLKAGISGIVDVGKNIVQGVWQGIQALAGWLKDKVKGFLGGIVDSVKGVLGIHSPSKVFAGIGKFMAMGLGEGWDDEYSSIKRDIEGGLDFSANANISPSVSAVSASSYGGNGGDSGVFNIVVQSVLDGRVIGETAYNYSKNRLRAAGV